MMLRILYLSCLLASRVRTVDSQFYPPKFGDSITLKLDSFYDTSYTVQCDAYMYFSVMFPFPCADLVISLQQSQGSPEIYVSKADISKDPYPTREKLTWSATVDKQYRLTIDRYDPESSPGNYYIGIFNSCSKQGLPAIFKIQALKTVDLSVSLYLTDIYASPALGQKQTVAANQYASYRFCIPVCGNVLVTLQNCVDNKICKGAYSFPELLVSRTTPKPSLEDYRCCYSNYIFLLHHPRFSFT